MKPDFTIIVPALNEEKHLADELKALRRLAPNAEIIVSDGRSTDNTRKIARELADKVVMQSKDYPHKSIGAGRNLGAKAASTEIMLFCDADTVPQKRFLKNMRVAFKDYAVVGYGAKVLPRGVGFMDRAIFEFLNLLVFVSSAFGRPTISGNCVAYRKKAFFEVEGFDEEMQASEDQDLCIRISRKGRVVYDAHSIAWTSSRRLKEMGWFGLMLDWGRTTLNFVFGRKNKRYAIVREV
jgi:cellulose synthase/poly-beta-1,6-N-acetylglucosamine synthase-like glycosyltransferase